MKQLARRLLQLQKSSSGASAVEFALVVPVFLLMLFGIIEFARLLWTTHALHETVIATARCMAIPQLECEDGGVYSADKVKTFAENKAAGWLLDIGFESIVLDHDASCNGVEEVSRVEINYQFVTAVPMLLTSFAGGTSLRAVSCYANQ
ncbi:TadE/TadG family type IV pilus assembly protein [Rhizobium hainanense]|uniref:TadE-like protein n=1 Tax=Rhizobium hainanense TaxID=52131 RepID=A0A1C3W7F4_9HYPH|nr:TadE family protein [Rhizobium hainanense]SCB36117.1 TadE-like protein [Rhizobium hainanense]